MKIFKGLAAVAVIVAIAWISYGLFATSPKEAGIEPAAGEEGAAPGQPMPIKVSTLAKREVQIWREFSGKLVAVDTVDIRPRVGGTIQEVYFEPGQIVEKDQKLFLIDPRPYQAAVNRAAADLAVARNQAVLAKSESDRAQRLIKENALSQREFDERQNNNRVAQANIQALSAALEQAKLNLQYATITSPIRGKISRAEITVGNLVDANDPQVLASIVSLDEIYADFDIDETTYVKNVRKSVTHTDEVIPVQLVLNTDNSVAYDGKILAFDNKLDPSAGTIRVRAIFENKDQALVPGMFAQIRLGNAEKQQVILIPESIVSTDQDKKFVYIIDEKNMVTYRPVKLGQAVDGMRVVEEGLTDGERVVVKGIQRLRPGMPVSPVEVPLVEEVKSANQAPTAETPPAEGKQADKAEEPALLQPVDAPTGEEAAPADVTTEQPTAEALPEPVKE